MEKHLLKAEWDRRYPVHKKERWNGLVLSTENRKGSIRSGIDIDGKPWRVKMKNDYGRILGTIGKDGEHVDYYKGTDDHSNIVYVIHQVNPFRGHVYDEDKCMIGYSSLEQAKESYLKHYNRDDFIGETTEFSIDEFKDALKYCMGRRLQKMFRYK